MRAAHVKADHSFAAALYGQLASEQGNLVFSPASIRSALAMAALGARGETAAEMARTLAFTGEQDHEDLAAVLAEWRARSEPAGQPAAHQRDVLRVVNRLWGQTGYTIQPEFCQALLAIYASSLQALDFAGDCQASRLAINAWVREQTEGRIADLLSPPHVQPDTRMILTNAVYLKAMWAHEFTEWGTREGPFWTAAAAHVPAQLMTQTTTLGYADLRDCQIVELPYAADKLGMIVILPRVRDGLPRLEQALARSGLEPWLGERRPTLVHVVLPRFRATSLLSLATVLLRMDMAHAFRYGQADFSGIDGTRELYLSDAIHQAFIAVDEHGTDAAAATALVLISSCIPLATPQPKEFCADHPFLFLLHDRENGRIVFMGRVVDPRGASTD